MAPSGDLEIADSVRGPVNDKAVSPRSRAVGNTKLDWAPERNTAKSVRTAFSYVVMMRGGSALGITCGENI